MINHSFDIYFGNQKKRLHLGRNSVTIYNRVHSNGMHNLAGEKLEISIDPSIQVITSDNRNSSFSILVRNQTFVNLEGMNAYGSRDDKEGLFTFSLNAESPFERDLIVFYLRQKFARGKIHELDRAAKLKDITNGVMALGIGKEFTMTENDWTLLSINANEYFYQKGSLIFKEGMSNRSLYRVLGGYVQIIKEKKNVIIGRMGAGSLIGEMSLLGEGIATASVIAESDVKIVEISLDYIQKIFEVESDLALKLFHNLAIRLALRFQSLVNGRREQPAPKITNSNTVQEDGAGFVFRRKNVAEAIKSGEDFMVIREYDGKHHKMPGHIQMHSHRMIFQTGLVGVVLMKIINYFDITRVDSINRGADFGVSISIQDKKRARVFFLSDEMERDRFVGILENIRAHLETKRRREELHVPLPEAKGITIEQKQIAEDLLNKEKGDWKDLLNKTKSALVTKGTYLIHDGEPETKLYQIIKGNCRIEKDGVVLSVLGRGEIVGIMGFLGISPIFGNVIADNDVELFIIDSDELKKSIRNSPHIGSQFFKHVAQVLDINITRGEDVAFPSSR
eukprot:TRINITY_DN2240_c0_g1_i5.p1 TRINITY_DN2240_c0_g1~~TRINITY_DN2240_c0_g1_i5.p1  ORF type:complete len:564 (+),score=113.41 TRINITY_DN2240_c0_g1_i5:664-2355(+)